MKLKKYQKEYLTGTHTTWIKALGSKDKSSWIKRKEKEREREIALQKTYKDTKDERENMPKTQKHESRHTGRNRWQCIEKKWERELLKKESKIREERKKERKKKE